MNNRVFSDRDIHEPELCDFFLNYENIKDVQKAQRLRGLNDYNVFTSLLRETDEVRLHSSFIFSLLDPDGLHYQGNLFLDKFISVIGLKEFDLNLKTTKVFKEYKNIDLYITDGNKHVIIENKIYARDQERQLSSYIEKIRALNKIDSNDVYERVFVIYLSLDRMEPSKASIPDYTLQDNILRKNDSSLRFKPIHYINEIINWLDECKKEVVNLTNLNQAIDQYRDVVLLINNKYKGKTMSLKEFLDKDIEKWNIFDELGAQHDTLLYNIYKDLSNEIFLHIKSKIKNESSLGSVEVLRRNSDTFLYAGGWLYINFHLKNKNILQLQYDSLFNLKEITVQFFLNETRKNEKQVSFPCAFNMGNTKKPYELLFNDENLNNFLAMHDLSFMEKIDSLIDDYR